jgi:hypothetical protein
VNLGKLTKINDQVQEVSWLRESTGLYLRCIGTLYHVDYSNKSLFPVSLSSSMNYSPSGKYLANASGYYGNEAEIIEAFSGKKIKTLKGHTKQINNLLMLPEQNKIVISSDDNSTKLFSIKDLSIYIKFIGNIPTDVVPWNNKRNLIATYIENSFSVGQSHQQPEFYIYNLEEESVEQKFELGNDLSKYGSNTFLPVEKVNDYSFSPNELKIAIAGYGLYMKDLSKRNVNFTLKDYSFDGVRGGYQCCKWSNDGRYLATHNHEHIFVFNAINGDSVCSFDIWGKANSDIFWSKNSGQIVSIHNDVALIHSIESPEKTKTINFPRMSLTYASWAHDDKKIAFCGNNFIKLYNIQNESFEAEISENETVFGKTFWYDDNSGLVTRTFNGSFQFRWYAFPEKELEGYIDYGLFKPIYFNSKIDLSYNNYQIKLNDIKSGDELIKIVLFDSSDYFVYTPDNYYKTTKNALNWLSFKIDNRLYSFEQFDLKYNRPDIVLARLGYADSTLIQAYHKAYLKRLKKMSFTEEDLGEDFHMPESKIKNFEYLPSITEEEEIELELNFNDSKYKLDRINVWINNVAVFGVDGINLRKHNTSNFDKKIELELSTGENKIQVSCLNQKGVESYKETVYITKEGKKYKPDLYMVCVGISEYKNSAFNLTYAAKDAQDMVNAFKDKKEYGDVHFKILTNEKVTKSSLEEIRDFFELAGRDDVVMLFIAGHGLLDKNLDYYFGTYDMDFNNPSEKGIAYEEIEALLDGLTALKKILFMDTCHSGEVDKDEIEKSNGDNVPQEKGELVFRSVGTGVQKKESIGLNNTNEMMKELFTDLRKGTGATVISSAGGGGICHGK